MVPSHRCSERSFHRVDRCDPTVTCRNVERAMAPSSDPRRGMAAAVFVTAAAAPPSAALDRPQIPVAAAPTSVPLASTSAAATDVAVGLVGRWSGAAGTPCRPGCAARWTRPLGRCLVRVSLEVEELHRQLDAALAVGDRVVQALEHRCTALGQSFDGDELPQRSFAVERLPHERGGQVVQRSIVGRPAHVHPPQVVVQIEVGVLDPRRVAQRVVAGHDTLTESRHCDRGTRHPGGERRPVGRSVEHGQVRERRGQLGVAFELPHQGLEPAHLVSALDRLRRHHVEANQRSTRRDARRVPAMRQRRGRRAFCRAGDLPATSLPWWTPTWSRVHDTSPASPHHTGATPRSRDSSVAEQAAADACPLGNDDVTGARRSWG